MLLVCNIYNTQTLTGRTEAQVSDTVYCTMKNICSKYSKHLNMNGTQNAEL